MAEPDPAGPAPVLAGGEPVLAATNRPTPVTPGWVWPTLTGVAGLVLGLVLGAVGVGLLSAWHHGGPGGPGGRGPGGGMGHRDDDRGFHHQDDRGRRGIDGPLAPAPPR